MEKVRERYAFEGGGGVMSLQQNVVSDKIINSVHFDGTREHLQDGGMRIGGRYVNIISTEYSLIFNAHNRHCNGLTIFNLCYFNN